MGFDPSRHHRRSRLDLLYVGSSVVAFLAMIAWALFG
jgi:hypothetical protein